VSLWGEAWELSAHEAFRELHREVVQWRRESKSRGSNGRSRQSRGVRLTGQVEERSLGELELDDDVGCGVAREGIVAFGSTEYNW
jgi:hypothetical protein